jgi:hypothetical protein
MDKEARLRELRELSGVHGEVHKVNNVNKTVNTDVDVVKYLDALRRKATTIEVDMIDLIMRYLFYEGKNKVTGRVHGEKVQEARAEKTRTDDRKAYHREYMRKRRAKNAVG